ncbi:MAG: T9SS type A sorting domain-containing protein [Ignavibacteria bacterium]|nr:T9SS type A sorting domain-containing protein [Ignavibacteria bacterium]
MKRQNKAVFLAGLILLYFMLTNISQSQWIQSNGPLGGTIRQQVFNSSNDAFLATNGGVFGLLSTGSAWYLANNGLTTLDIRALAVIGNNLFAGGYEVPNTPGGVFISTNKGNSWNAVNTGLTNRTIISLGTNGTNLYAGTNGAGIFLSTNNGTMWTSVNSGLSSGSLTVNCFYSNASNVYAGTNDGIAVTTNNGANWMVSSNGLATSFKAIYSINVKAGILFVATRAGVYSSTDNGVTFTNASGNIGNSSINCLINDGTYLFAGTQGGGVYKTSNNGVNWIAANVGLTNLYVSTIQYIPAPNYIYIGTQGDGIFYSLNYSNWLSQLANLYNTSPRTICVKNGNVFTGTLLNGIYKTINSGTNWSTVNSGLPPLSNVLDMINDGTNLYAATSSGIYKSVNDGTNWTGIGNAFTPTNYFQAIIKIGTTLYAGSFGGGVYTSVNEGANWSAVNAGLTNLNVWDMNYDGSYIYAATADGGVFRYPLSGSSWTPINNGLPTGYDIRSLYISGSRIYAGFNGLFVSTNNGDNWNSISNDSLNGKKIRSIYSYENGNKIITGTYNNGIFVSQNGGANFYSVNLGLPQLSEVFCITVLNDQTVFIGLNGLGVWRRPLSEVVSGVSNIGTAIPETYTLGQNYPNPFNPSTTIRFEIPKSSNVTMKVYDLSGKEVSSIVNGYYKAGVYEATFNASNLSSGVYFYKIIADNFSSTKKMMVVK